MPDFSRLRKALMLQGEPDRVPMIELKVVQDVKSAFLGRPVRDLESEVEFWVAAGYDHIPLAVGMRTLLRNPHAYLQTSGKGAGSVGPSNRQIVAARYSLYTPELQERQWAEQGAGVITTTEDFERFLWPRAEDLDYSLLENAGRYLPPGMKVIAMTGTVFSLVWWLMGLETFCAALTENPGLVARMFEKVGSIQREVVRIASSFDCVGAVWANDDIAYSHALMISPRYLRQYLFPWFKEMSSLCREKDLPFIYHSDGKLTQVLGDLIDCGFNALHPIEPKAMDIVEIKRRVGHRMCVCGNLDLAYTLTLGTPAEVEAEVKQRLREVAPGGGYCLGSSNSVTEYVPLANYNAMRETVLRYGSYPISIP